MKLQEHMTLKGLSRETTAKQLDISVEGLKKILRGVRTPRPELQRRIYKWSGKRVTPNDFILR